MRGSITWSDYLASEGVSVLVKAAVGPFSAAALLPAVVVDDMTVRAGSLLVLILAVAVLVGTLVSARRSLQRRLDRADELVVRYVKFIQAMEPGYRITSWDKTVVMSANGDAVDILKVRARVVRPDVQFFWLWFGCGWPQPTKYRDRVEVRVRNLLVGDLPGTSLDRTLSWISDGRLAVIAHLHRPPAVGSEICIKLEVVWPGKCVPLMRGECDEFTIAIDTSVQLATYKLVLPKGCDTYWETLGFRDGDAAFALTSEVERGCLTYRIETRDLHPGRRIGLRLELKKRALIDVR